MSLSFATGYHTTPRLQSSRVKSIDYHYRIDVARESIGTETSREITKHFDMLAGHNGGLIINSINSK